MSTEPLNSLLEAGTGMDAVNEKLYGVKYAEPAPERNGHLTVRHSEQQGKLALALSKAQLAFEPAKKQVENTFFSSAKRKAMYADLSALIKATQKPLAENELVVMQFPLVDLDKKRAGVLSRLVHSSNEWVEVEFMLPASAANGKFDAQTIGSATAYARRYTYGPAVGIATEEDDDGNSIGEASQGSHEAQQAVAQAKIKSAVESGKTPALFYSFDDGKQEGYVTGDLKLIEANVELLRSKGKWSVKDKAFITDANGLEDYKYELGQRGVPFMPLKGTEVTAALQESIAQAKAAKKGDA